MPSRAPHPAADFNQALRCTSAPEAFASLLSAAQAGCLRAQFLVGLAYQTGTGVAQDYERAAEWYCKAAGSGDSNAIANLGVMSLLGQGTPADDLDAYLWVQSAVGLGHEWLRPALEMLERNLSGADSGDRKSLLASLCPVTPSFRPCSLPGCDPSRCNVA